MKNAVHCTDLSEDGVLEVRNIFLYKNMYSVNISLTFCKPTYDFKINLKEINF